MAKLYISKPVCWAPGVTEEALWQDWKNGKISIQKTTEAPAISFTSPLFRRRLSQICKMVIQAVHDIIEQTSCGDIKQIFVSTYGDIKRQFDVSRQTLVDKEILPASFSYSVFNAPIALASLACKLKSGYSVLFPAENNFKDAFTTTAAPVLCGDEKSQIFVYANELIPEEYKGHFCATAPDGTDLNEPFVFAAVISGEKSGICNHEVDLENSDLTTPQAFLKEIL
ncbi:MAG: beta-ketoacyl synthase chain length factor [Treponema sp.]|nr:beta-ketoacyl synthase chain length factor [Treponema sp.]